jgi:hypothetical protein
MNWLLLTFSVLSFGFLLKSNFDPWGSEHNGKTGFDRVKVPVSGRPERDWPGAPCDEYSQRRSYCLSMARRANTMQGVRIWCLDL